MADRLLFLKEKVLSARVTVEETDFLPMLEFFPRDL